MRDLMQESALALSATCLTLTAAFSLGTTARAQQQAAPIMEEVVVVAPRLYRREQVGRAASGAPIERISVTRRVSYADLDLKLHADVMELEKRVRDMAKEACEQTDTLFRLENLEPSTAECIRRTEDAAMLQVHEAIAASQ